MPDRRLAGRKVEEFVAERLERDGYTVRDRNWTCAYGELDIVALDGDILVFVEVRSRRSIAFGTAVESVTTSKLDRVVTTAEMYIQDHPDLGDLIWRVDIVGVAVTPDGQIIDYEHIQNVSLD
ncbi:MAG: YraN family protein [Chloroflexota bacterium]